MIALLLAVILAGQLGQNDWCYVPPQSEILFCDYVSLSSCQSAPNRASAFWLLGFLLTKTLQQHKANASRFLVSCRYYAEQNAELRIMLQQLDWPTISVLATKDEHIWVAIIQIFDMEDFLLWGGDKASADLFVGR